MLEEEPIKDEVETEKEDEFEEKPKKRTKEEVRDILVEKENAAAKRTEAAAENLKIQLDRQERIKAEDTIAGEADAGQTSIKKEETPQEYKDKVMRGELDDNTT